MSEDVSSIELSVDSTGIKASAHSRAVDRILHTLADIISPVSNGAGLLGTHLRGKRIENALKASLRVQKLLSDSGLKSNLVPLKVLHPWLEGASLEDAEADPEMAELWARLLHSAATESNPNASFFIDILKRISGDHARYLKSLVSFTDSRDVAQDLWDTAILFSADRVVEDLYGLGWKTKSSELFENAIGSASSSGPSTAFTQDTLVQLVTDRIKLLASRSGVDAISLELVVYGQLSGQIVETIQIIDTDFQRYDNFGLKESLIALGLVEHIELKSEDIGSWVKISGRFIKLTTLGVNFLSACTELR